jgi:hypothetical protein
MTKKSRKRVEKVTKKVLSTILVNEPEPEFMSPKDASKRFGIKEFTIRHLVRTDRVKGKRGKPFLVNVKSLRAFIGE